MAQTPPICYGVAPVPPLAIDLDRHQNAFETELFKSAWTGPDLYLRRAIVGCELLSDFDQGHFGFATKVENAPATVRSSALNDLD